MKRRTASRTVPTDQGSPEERRAFAQFLFPIYQQEFQRELLSPAPHWMYLMHLHRRILELEEEA